MPIDTPWFKVREAAEYARRHEQTVKAALRSGELRGNQTGRGGTWLIHRDDLDAWIRGEIATAEPVRVTRPRRAS